MTSPRPRSELVSADGGATPVEHGPLDAAHVVGGAPTAGTTPLLMQGGVEVGVWEIEDGPSIPLAPGATVRLEAGDRTT